MTTIQVMDTVTLVAAMCGVIILSIGAATVDVRLLSGVGFAVALVFAQIRHLIR